MIAVGEYTIGNALKRGREQLESSGVADALHNLEIMLEYIFGMSRTELFLNRDRELNEHQRFELEDKIRRRVKGEPLQYLVGETEFFGLRMKCDRRALIPRPETEVLVEKTLEAAEKFENPQILDIGTGGGAIAIALAANLNCPLTAIDSSEVALTLAKENAVINRIEKKIDFVRADFLNTDFKFLKGSRFDMVVSNPPYVSLEEMEMLDIWIRDYEPLKALTDGGDGLAFYRRLAEVLPKIANEDCIVLLEMAENRAEKVREIMEQSLTSIEIIPDLAGKLRILRGECSSK